MQKIKAFLYIFKNSLSSPAYYLEILEAKKWFTTKYFLMLSVTLSLALTTKVALTQIPAANKLIAQGIEYATNMYPDDLIIEITNGKWSLNKPEPYEIPFPNIEGFRAPKKNIAVLYNKGTIDDLEILDTMILVNSKNIIAEENGQIKATPIENLPSGQFVKRDFVDFIHQLEKFKIWVPYVIVALSLGGLFAYFALIVSSNILALAVVVWLLAKLSTFNPTYTQAAKITAHTATLPMTIFTVGHIAGMNVPLNGWFTLLNLLFAMFVCVQLGKKASPGKEAAESKDEGTITTPDTTKK